MKSKLTLAPEGGPFVVSSLVAAVISGFIGMATHQTSFQIVALICTLFAVFCFHFFRDPLRIPPIGDNIILSPADGKVVFVGEIGHDPDLKAPVQQISIFLSLFNVHVNRIPVEGTVKSVNCRKGRFLAAFKEEASKVNEQTAVLIQTKDHLVKVKQIAGILARRILCYLQNGDAVSLGDRFGFIRFGSRTDVVLPLEASISVSVGQTVIGGETIIGELK
ncbi:MAG: phosphatidylserine decarboxylase family protein [Candidatus Marinimicrobia bacterium]|nr:phosphatidylserine decarboxylase family protein [Candidatus Neomarinimicrobiota bacterium]MDP6568947.1 phosphatidylserine decarboxylase family protein [Candidatus Neomarinimicrobiota bacterium]MDP7026000.1 phosphatidylserine decarboxylase family protein [Candidatus Neomarinimicrobiota bacterium]